MTDDEIMKSVLNTMINHGLYNKTRELDIAIPRMYCFWFLKKKTEKTNPEIGKFLNRNQSTISNAKKTIQNIIDTDPKYIEDMVYNLVKDLPNVPDKIRSRKTNGQMHVRPGAKLMSMVLEDACKRGVSANKVLTDIIRDHYESMGRHRKGS